MGPGEHREPCGADSGRLPVAEGDVEVSEAAEGLRVGGYAAGLEREPRCADRALGGEAAAAMDNLHQHDESTITHNIFYLWKTTKKERWSK